MPHKSNQQNIYYDFYVFKSSTRPSYLTKNPQNSLKFRFSLRKVILSAIQSDKQKFIFDQRQSFNWKSYILSEIHVYTRI